MKLLTFYLIRQYFKEKYTIGKLYCTGCFVEGKKSRLIETQYVCDILEDKFRGNDLSKTKVKGETCIPEGVYEVKMTFSPRFNRLLPELQKVPYFEGIRIHSGNTIDHTEGCLLPGINKVVGKVLESKIYTDLIIEKINQYDYCNIVVKNEKRI